MYENPTPSKYFCVQFQMPSYERSTFKVIRLAMAGCKNRPFYHITVCPNRRPRNYGGGHQIGTFDPLPNNRNEKLVSIDFEKLNKHLAKGAKVSKPVAQLLGNYIDC